MPSCDSHLGCRAAKSAGFFLYLPLRPLVWKPRPRPRWLHKMSATVYKHVKHTVINVNHNLDIKEKEAAIRLSRAHAGVAGDKEKARALNGSLPPLTFSTAALPRLLWPDTPRQTMGRQRKAPSSRPWKGFYGVTVALYLRNYFSISAMNISNTVAQLFYSHGVLAH